MNPQTSTTGSDRRRAAIGVAAVALTVGATGVAYGLATHARPAAEVTAGDAPQAPVDNSVDEAPATDDPTATDVLPGPYEYTQERWEAFFGAGYYMEDASTLADLWNLDLLEAKGRAGQLLLDGQPVPIAPGSSLDLTDPATISMLEFEAFIKAGYTGEDGAALAALWSVDVDEAKATAGKMLRAGQTLPLGPSGTPVS
jgi:hypothetical protein